MIRKLDWRSLYSPTPLDELEWIEQKLEDYVGEGEFAIEIGSYEGASTVLIAQFFKTVMAIDPWGEHETTPGERIAVFSKGLATNEHFPKFMRNIENLGLIDSIIPIVGTSHCLDGFYDLKADFVFIDDGHDEPSVKRDLEKVRGHLDNQNSLVMVHDYKRKGFEGDDSPYIGVHRAVDEGIASGTWAQNDFYSGVIALNRSY